MTSHSRPTTIEPDQQLLAALSRWDVDTLEGELTSARDAIEGVINQTLWRADQETELQELTRLRLESDLLRIDQWLADLFAIPEAPEYFVFVVNDNAEMEVWGDRLASRFWTQILVAGKHHGWNSVNSRNRSRFPGPYSSSIDELLARLISESTASQ